MILSCQQISLAFGTEVILDKISFHIEEMPFKIEADDLPF